MKIDVMEKRNNPFMKRIDLMLSIDHTGKPTPRKDELVKTIAEKFKSVPEKVEIVYIFTETGKARSKAKARIWKEKVPEKKKLKEEKEKPKTEEVRKEIKESRNKNYRAKEREGKIGFIWKNFCFDRSFEINDQR